MWVFGPRNDGLLQSFFSLLLLIGRVLNVTLKGNLSLGRETNALYFECNKYHNENATDFSCVVIPQTLRGKVC